MSKTILITGTSSGFGKLTATTLAKDGHSVIAAMRNISTKNAVVAKELNSLDNIEVIEMDVTSDVSVNAAIQSVLKKYGHIDVLINNAGILGLGIVEGTSVDQMKKVFDTNLWGTVRGYQAVLPSMRQQRSGLIINISSGYGLFSGPYTVPYNMTKFSMQALTEGIRHEIKGFGIETITVLPGPFPTEVAGNAGSNGPDKPEIIEAYGDALQSSMTKFGEGMFGKIAEYQADPQEVADALKKLIDMKPGTRPFETIVNRMGEGIEQVLTDSRLPLYTQLMKNIGIGELV